LFTDAPIEITRVPTAFDLTPSLQPVKATDMMREMGELVEWCFTVGKLADLKKLLLVEALVACVEQFSRVLVGRVRKALSIELLEPTPLNFGLQTKVAPLWETVATTPAPLLGTLFAYLTQSLRQCLSSTINAERDRVIVRSSESCVVGTIGAPSLSTMVELTLQHRPSIVTLKTLPGLVRATVAVARHGPVRRGDCPPFALDAHGLAIIYVRVWRHSLFLSSVSGLPLRRFVPGDPR
jgi:hypothetical protein